jgi:hypothetical protein
MLGNSWKRGRAIHECAEAIRALHVLWCRSKRSMALGAGAIYEPVLVMADISGLVIDESLEGSAAAT